MYKAAQVFSGQFRNLRAHVTITQIINPTGVEAVTPYTFVAARSFNAPVEIISITQSSGVVPVTYALIEDEAVTIHTYRATVAAPVEIIFTDATGTRFYARGTVSLALDIRTPLTIEQLFANGPLTAYIEFSAASGVFTNGGFDVLITGTATIMSLCPALLRVRYEGECTFRPASDEGVDISAVEPLVRR
jgi:hypothetical protein